MKKINYDEVFSPIWEDVYKPYIKEQIERIQSFESKYLSGDPFFYNTEYWHTDFERICKVHRNLTFCTNPIVLRKIQRDWKLRPEHMRWFIPLSDVLHLFDAIVKMEIFIDKPKALFYIQSHLQTNFYNELEKTDMKIYGYRYNKDRGLLSTQAFKKLKVRYESDTLTGDDGENSEGLLSKEILEALGIKVNAETLKILDQLSRGKTDFIFLTPLADECLIYKEDKIINGKRMTNNRYMATIYDLYRSIAHNWNLPDKTQFREKNLKETNFDTYKAKTLRKYLYKKENRSYSDFWVKMVENKELFFNQKSYGNNTPGINHPNKETI